MVTSANQLAKSGKFGDLRRRIIFLLLALATTGVFIVGTQQVVRSGWQGYAKPLVADYVDRLAAEIGSPPDLSRAQAIVQRLPLSVRIEGPAVNWDSHLAQRHGHGSDPWDPEHAGGTGVLSRTTADGHRIVFGAGDPAAARPPRVFGWLSLAVLLLYFRKEIPAAYDPGQLKPPSAAIRDLATFRTGWCCC